MEGTDRLNVQGGRYVVLDEKIAVLDTVDPRKTAQWLDNLERALEGRAPDYLVRRGAGDRGETLRRRDFLVQFARCKISRPPCFFRPNLLC